MYQSQKTLEVTNIYTYRRYEKQMLVVMAVLLFSLVSGSAFAREDNPGLLATCTGNSVKGLFDNTQSNYTNIMNSFDTKTYQSVTSTSSSPIPLRIKMTINDSGVNSTGNNTTITGSNAYPAIDINRNFIGSNSRSNITLDFQNANNSKETYLDKVALSVFDIDKSISRGTGWDDLVKITGVTENDGVIEGRLQTIANSSVIKGTDGLRTSSNSNNNCTSILASDCQGSIVFDKPVKSVTLRYSNTSNVTNPTTQRIQFRLDSYCYTPEYTFTGYVFNDNGGIARSTNPDTKSDTSSTFTGNSRYFNGVFDNGETGIGTTTNLSVSLTNCNGVNLGNTTSQNTSNNPLGQYKFTVPASVIAALNPQKVCIVQAEPDSWTYSVDTTPNNRSVDLQNGKFDYKTEGAVNLDFGEVEADYAALVLRKAQFVNNCPSTLDYSASTLNTAGNTNPRTGFSESGISGSDLVPGQCIAYRIQAYNRGHINLQSIQIKDELQVTPVKSVFHLPFPVGLPNNINNNSNRLPNSEIMSNQFNLEAAPLSGNAPKATLYFNTKYRTTIDP